VKPRWVLVTALALAAPTGAGEPEELRRQIDLLRCELAEAQALVKKVRTELSELRAGFAPSLAESYEEWKSRRQALQRERLAVNRELRAVAFERSQVQRLAALHRSRHPAPPAPSPVSVSSPAGPRYVAPPAPAYRPPLVTYYPPLFFSAPLAGPCLTPGPIIFRQVPIVRFTVRLGK
jgi:hypothetical protein